MKTANTHKNGIESFGLNDAEAVAAIHRECFPHYFSTKLGSGFYAEMYRLYATTNDGYGFVLWLDGERVGFVVGGISNIHSQINQTLRMNAAAAMLMRPKLIFKKISDKFSKIRKKDQPPAKIPVVFGEKLDRSRTAKLVLIGVKETARGTKAAAKLMQAFCKEAANRGFEAVILTVSRDNLRARAAYEKAGWSLIDKGGESVEYYIDAAGSLI